MYHFQPFVEGSGGVQLLSDLTLSDMDHQERFNLTQAEVRSRKPLTFLCHTHPLILEGFPYTMNRQSCIIHSLPHTLKN